MAQSSFIGAVATSSKIRKRGEIDFLRNVVRSHRKGDCCIPSFATFSDNVRSWVDRKFCEKHSWNKEDRVAVMPVRQIS